MPEAPKRIVIATHNIHKTEEFRVLLGEDWRVEDLTSHADLPVPEENGATFEENAAIKALSAAQRLGEAVLVVADDSGLEVDALGGRPGIYSARYAGTAAGDAGNRDKVLEEMREVPDGKRGARFRCVLVLVRGGAVLATCAGVVEGRLTRQASGGGGFGYDPIFVPAGYDRTFGELPPEMKNGLSHRARALAALRRELEATDSV